MQDKKEAIEQYLSELIYSTLAPILLKYPRCPEYIKIDIPYKDCNARVFIEGEELAELFA